MQSLRGAMECTGMVQYAAAFGKQPLSLRRHLMGDILSLWSGSLSLSQKLLVLSGPHIGVDFYLMGFQHLFQLKSGVPSNNRYERLIEAMIIASEKIFTPSAGVGLGRVAMFLVPSSVQSYKACEDWVDVMKDMFNPWVESGYPSSKTSKYGLPLANGKAVGVFESAFEDEAQYTMGAAVGGSYFGQTGRFAAIRLGKQCGYGGYPSAENIGVALAHELGHLLGLSHVSNPSICSDCGGKALLECGECNLMAAYIHGVGLNTSQVNMVKKNASPPCP